MTEEKGVRGLRAVIFGATGMVGEGVLHMALRHPDIEKVLVIGRRSCEVTDARLTEIIHGDFFDLSGIGSRLEGHNACFFCLGVSSIGMKEDAYRRMTYDLTMAAATALARVNPDMTFCYVSGAGTDSSERGRLMWARIKGKTENDLKKLRFKAVYAFRPGFIKPIHGLRRAFRIARVLGAVYPALHALFPNQMCTLEDLGNAMIQAARYGYDQWILENRDIAACARQGFAGPA